MRVAVSLLAALALATTAASAQSNIQRGTIAVIPFGAGSAAMAEAAAAFAIAVENALMESGRFTAVLQRAADAAIKAEIDKTTEPTNLNSLVQIAQDAQLNANYLLAGWVMGQDVKTSRDANGKETHTAQARLAVRIVDVSTGAMVVSDIVTVHSGQTMDICPDGIRRAVCEAQNHMKRTWAHGTPAEALKSIVTNGNAQIEIEKSLNEKLGYIVLDLIEGNGGAQLVLRAVNGNPKKGTKLLMVQTRTSSLNGTTYNTPIGKLEVTEVTTETAMATIKEGADKILKALTEKQPVLVLKG